MKKNCIQIGLLCLVVFLLGQNLHTPVISQPIIKVAVVDIEAVMKNSKSVAQLQKAQQAKLNELQKFINNANAQIDKTSDTNKKKELQKKYTDELNSKKATIKKEYLTQLTNINKQISTTINNTAKTEGYSLVLTSQIVLFGGDDITDKILKVIK